MNLNEYIRWLRETYGDANISFTGIPMEEPVEPTETDRVVELGKILGRKLGEFEHRLDKTDEDISILYGLYEKNKETKTKRKVRKVGNRNKVKKK